MVLEVCFDLQTRAEYEKKCSRFFGGHFLWSFFRATLGKNPSHPQKFACSYTYAQTNLTASWETKNDATKF